MMSQEQNPFERTISNLGELQADQLYNQLFGLKILKLVNCNIQPYAIPSHVLSYLNCLEELEVRCCYEVEVIFDSWIVRRTAPFNLQKLTLKELHKLTRVWKKNHDGICCFQNLQHVSVKGCSNLRSLFPAALAKNLKKLESLQIGRCDALLKIVEKVEDAAADATEKFEFLLTLLNLSGSQNLRCFYPETFIPEELSNLTHVWKKNHDGICCFQNLQHVSVKKCCKLQSLFPAALAKNLKKLESLQIERCDALLKIVEKVEYAAADTTEKFVFPCLTLLNLSGSQNLRCFYPETFILECPALKNLSIFKCDKLEVFQSNGEGSSSTSINKQPLLFNSKVTSNIEKLSLDLWTDTSERLWSAQFTPKLQDMSIHNCRGPKIFNIQDANIAEHWMLGHLKILRLIKAFKLQFIVYEDTPWLNTICENLHELDVSSCHCLTTLTHSTSVTSFSSLKKLIISDCEKLKYLFTSSAAKKLLHLEMIIARDCESMKEIVAKGQQDETTSEEIKFERLYYIELYHLQNLECFYSGNDTLQLPSLKQMIICSCPKMEFFSQGPILAKYFKGIQETDNSNDDLVFHNDINSSVKRVYLQQGFLHAMHGRCLSDHLEKARDHKVGLQNEWLCDLVTLQLDNCFLPYAIPSFILPYLKNLKELKVDYSNKVKVIFELNDTDHMETAVKLEKLHLEGLSELTHVWEKNSQGVLIFQNLQQVFVSRCKNLQTLFPISLATSTSTVSFFCLREMHITKCPELQYLFTSSVAKMLMNIEEITVEECESMKKIVAKDYETTSEGIIFEQLRSIHLITLSSLECFYSGDDTLQLSSLIQVKILQCPKMEIFSRGLIHAAESFRGIQASSNTNDQLVFHDDLNASVKLVFLQQDSG